MGVEGLLFGPLEVGSLVSHNDSREVRRVLIVDFIFYFQPLYPIFFFFLYPSEYRKPHSCTAVGVPGCGSKSMKKEGNESSHDVGLNPEVKIHSLSPL
ncbi:hypothetical protein TNIN_170931 [Trichonephila inaurata madagascariensis]|uniref:Uncharacterized protein n=1 Tax=Trichonephila inaurata madagascariensis TaxID=2747483 RepID=A0A8X7CBI4_9ARAC|nr:hypothetical protein TNIN_170931 [Trichonephila inaurata madagascariensis]